MADPASLHSKLLAFTPTPATEHSAPQSTADSPGGSPSINVSSREVTASLFDKPSLDVSSEKKPVATQPALSDGTPDLPIDLTEQLFNGIKRNEVDAVRKAIRLGVKVSEAGDNRVMSALTAAAHCGNAEIISLLIAAGADPCKPDKAGQSAVEIACNNGFYAMLVPFTANGGSQVLENVHFASLLEKAVAKADIPTLQLIVNEGATKYMAKKDQDICMARLIEGSELEPSGSKRKVLQTSEQLDLIARMIGDGADVNGTHGIFKTPHLVWAAQNKNADILEILVNHKARIDDTDATGNSALMVAVERDAWMMFFLMSAKPNVNLVNKERQTALLMAAQAGRHENVNRLLMAGAKPDVKDGHHCGLLIAAVKSGDTKTVEAAIHAKVKIDQRDENGESALFYAVEKRSPEIIKLLVKSKANINLRNKKNDTSLIIACQSPHQQTIQTMLDLGADPSLRGYKGRTAFGMLRPELKATYASMLDSKKGDS